MQKTTDDIVESIKGHLNAQITRLSLPEQKEVVEQIITILDDMHSCINHDLNMERQTSEDDNV